MRARLVLSRTQCVMNLAIRLAVCCRDSYRFRNLLATELAFEQDAYRQILKQNEVPASAERIELPEVGQCARETRYDIGGKRQPLARALAVFGH